MTDRKHPTVPVALLAYARIKKLEAEVAARQEEAVAFVQTFIGEVNEARRDGDPEYKRYLRGCVDVAEDGIITLF